ncbi:MAG: HK97 family phage prohead protease [Salinarimonadaceae bacterium]|nr:MAG: HK97 family phage prohead protease [Salinarimonadaceae bacterium]
MTVSLDNGFTFALEAKAVADDGTFEGYASVFDVEDLGRDIVKAGAFRKSLRSRPSGRVKMLREHDMREPIGVWTDIVEDSKGLLARGRLVLDTTRGRETHALMKAGAIDGLSIGYRTIRDTIDRAKRVRVLHELDLFEISIVTLPMNPASTVTRVKAAENAGRARALVSALNRAREALRT